MASNRVLTPLSKNTPQIGKPPSPKIIYPPRPPPPPPPGPQTFYSPPLRQEMAASAFFTHGYFQQAHVHIFKGIITD